MTHNFRLINGDTDSLLINKQDNSHFSEEEREKLLNEINSILPEKIQFTDDGYFPSVVILKAKNYILYDGKKIKKKGSSLKSSKIEKGLSNFMDQIIHVLLFEDQSKLLDVYNKHIKLVNNLTSIDDFCSKKTITSSVLNPTRTTEQKILNAFGTKNVSMGDKIYVYFTKDQQLKLKEDWTNDHCPVTLMKKLYNVLIIFKHVIDMSVFPKYHLKNKKVKEQLEKVLNEV